MRRQSEERQNKNIVGGFFSKKKKKKHSIFAEPIKVQHVIVHVTVEEGLREQNPYCNKVHQTTYCTCGKRAHGQNKRQS